MKIKKKRGFLLRFTRRVSQPRHPRSCRHRKGCMGTFSELVWRVWMSWSKTSSFDSLILRSHHIKDKNKLYATELVVYMQIQFYNIGKYRIWFEIPSNFQQYNTASRLKTGHLPSKLVGFPCLLHSMIGKPILSQ